MTRRTLWWGVALLFTLLNLAAELFALTRLELEHAVIHGILMLVGAYFTWRLGPWRSAAATDAG